MFQQLSQPSALLAPVVALVLWTFVMWGWMYYTRIPAIIAARMRLDPEAPRGAQEAPAPGERRTRSG